MATTATLTKKTRKALDKAPSTDRLTDPKGLAAAGAVLLALPYAAQGIAKLAGGAREKAAEGGGKVSELKDKAADKASGKAKEVVGDVADEKLKPSMPKGLGGLFGGGGMFGGSGSASDSDSDTEGGSAVGSGRRMPIQQAVDVAAPLEDTYNLWTQFEDWPSYMHRLDSADQVDEATVAMSTKVWGISKRFEAQIIEQRPDERIEWDVREGLNHTGVVSFHELAPRLTRIEVTIDVEPDSLLEKAGRGMRFAKRAIRGDLHRFKAYAEMCEEAEDGWRGTIEGGEVAKKAGSKSSRSSARKSSSNGGSRGRSTNGGDPASGTRKSGSRN